MISFKVMKEALDSKFIVAIVAFVFSSFGIYYGLEAAVAKAQTTANTATSIAKNNDSKLDTVTLRLSEIDSDQKLIKYQLSQSYRTDLEQTQAIRDLAKVTQQIAAKLNVRTD